MITFLQTFWRKLRIRNQILIFQSLIVAISFALSCTLSLVLFEKFSQFIKLEVLEQTIIKSIISKTNIVIQEVNYLGRVEFYQTLSAANSLANLYEFQVSNDIKTNSEIPNCLQSPYSNQFYSYQFCSGKYGDITNNTDLEQINTFISLQNQIIPLSQLDLIKSYYNVYLDQPLYFSQYKGEYLVELKEEIKEALLTIKTTQSNDYTKQIKSDSGQMLLFFNRIPGTKIAYGSSQNLSQFQYIKAIQEMPFKQRNIGMLLDGFILSDTQNDTIGQYFQNISITGFNSSQFDKILNFTLKKPTINECEQILQDRYLCLIDNNEQKKLIFPFKVNANGLDYIIVVIVNTFQLIHIRNQSYQQLQSFIETQIYFVVLFIIASFLLCLLFQIILILKLNQPLKQLENLAKYHIYQYKFLGILSFSNQNEIQKLYDSFFNLIHSNEKIYKRYSTVKQTKQEKQFGLIQQRQIDMINFQIKQKIDIIA